MVECLDGPARSTSKELAPIHSVKSGTLQNACSTNRRMDADIWKSALVRIARLKNSPAKRSKKNDDKSAVAMLKKHELHDRTWQPVVCRDTRRAQGHGPVGCSSQSTRQLGCVFQDMEPPKLSSILRESSDLQKPIQRVKLTKAIVRHTKIRDQNPSLGMISPGEPHQRSPNAPKFEARSQEETEWQEQGAREAAWKLAKSLLNLKEQERATFFSPSEKRCLLASTLKTEEREFVVDSGASMHMISKKDLSDAEMDILTKSCSCTIVITANGKVQTHEEAIVYVKELDIFLTVEVLENTPAVLSLGKLCDENGYSYEWINGRKPYLIKNGIRIQCNTENFVPIVVPGLSNSSSGSDSSTSRTLSRQGSHCSTSSPSSSLSPTVSEIQTQEGEDRTESDISPVTVSTTVDERSGRPDIDQANKNRKTQRNPRGNRATRCLPTHDKQAVKSRCGCKNSEKNWWMTRFQNMETLCLFLMKCLQSPHSRQVGIWVNTVFILISLMTEIARGSKLQGPRAEDAMAEPYLV